MAGSDRSKNFFLNYIKSDFITSVICMTGKFMYGEINILVDKLIWH